MDVLKVQGPTYQLVWEIDLDYPMTQNVKTYS